MSILKNIRVDGRKIVMGYGFYISIFLTFILCLSSPIYKHEEKNETYSVIDVLNKFNKETMLEYPEMCADTVLMKGNRGWLSLFIPIISGFAFVPIICDEYNFKVVRNEIFRSTNFRFNTSKFVMACVSGGVAVMIGYALYICLISTLFPSFNLYQPELQMTISEEIYGSNPFFSDLNKISITFLKLGEIFLYGLFSSVFVVFLSSFVKNKYLVLCVPFFIQYGITQFCMKIRITEINNAEKMNEKLIYISNIILPESVADLSQYVFYIKYIIVYNIAKMILLYIAYMIINYRRVDYGE